ncbi:RIP metalloprotease RseP [Nitrosophilus alvini]|uniref:RIP metalloprotease RseP n=1 Tax=Nitrosophilus alvini TaxID=2714855 RepID=UPI001909084A|nr:RIP metalloprotease RseP [Nitrosophilus alvini]
MGFIVSLLVLSFLIFFHELGHFLAARLFGVKVERFSIGFGKVIAKKQIGETEWALSSIPLGGYVKMKGQDDTDPTKKSFDPDSYNSKKPWQRIIILFAGPFANFFLAFLLYFTIALMGSDTYAPVIGEVLPNSAAYEAGLKKGDKIIKIDDTPIRTWEDLSKAIKESRGTIKLVVERDGKVFNLELIPKISETKNIFGETVKRRMIGIAPSGDLVKVEYGFLESFKVAFERTVQAGKMIIVGIEKMIEGVVPLKEVGGVISIVDITAKASQIGIVALFSLTALISVNLGVLNLLPIPALDGGHIIFNLYEMITKRTPSEEVLYKLTLLGWFVLFMLMGLGIYNDINRLLGASNG